MEPVAGVVSPRWTSSQLFADHHRLTSLTRLWRLTSQWSSSKVTSVLHFFWIRPSSILLLMQTQFQGCRLLCLLPAFTWTISTTGNVAGVNQTKPQPPRICRQHCVTKFFQIAASIRISFRSCSSTIRPELGKLAIWIERLVSRSIIRTA